MIKKKRTYIHYRLYSPLLIQIIFNPQLIEDPDDIKQNASKDIFSSQIIKYIRLSLDYMLIEVQQKKEIQLQKYLAVYSRKDVITSFKFSNPEFQKQFENFSNSLTSGIPLYQKKILSEKNNSHEQIFFEMAKSLEGKSFMAWFIPVIHEIPKLKLLLFSRTILQQVDSYDKEFPLEIEKYKECAFE